MYSLTRNTKNNSISKEAWGQTMLSRSLVYCPDISELSSVKEWFEPQMAAINPTEQVLETIKRG